MTQKRSGNYPHRKVESAVTFVKINQCGTEAKRISKKIKNAWKGGLYDVQDDEWKGGDEVRQTQGRVETGTCTAFPSDQQTQ